MTVKFTTTSNCINRCQLKVLSPTNTAVFNELVRPCSFLGFATSSSTTRLWKIPYFMPTIRSLTKKTWRWCQQRPNHRSKYFLSADFVHNIRQDRSQTTTSLLLSPNFSVRDRTGKIWTQKITLNLDELSSIWNWIMEWISSRQSELKYYFSG